MKTKIIGFAIVLGFICSDLHAQWLLGGGPTNRFGNAASGAPLNQWRSFGIGNFTGNAANPLAALDINKFYLLPTANFAGGELFRSTGNSTNLNAWRLFTGATAGTTSEKFSLFVPVASNNAFLQATSGDMYFNTASSTFVVQERMRITNGIGNLIGVQQPNATRVNISYGAGYAPIANPVALLNLGFDGPQGPNGGQRPWMDVGTFTSASSDNMYVGLKNEDPNGNFGPNNNDRMDAVINWGDNNASQSAYGPDNMRFIFTLVQNPATPTGPASLNGLEAIRISPFSPNPFTTIMYTGIGGDPATNMYGPAQNSINPTNTLEVNSSGATNVVGGSSGLRFTNLNTTSPVIAVNPGAGVLAVDANGDVIYVQTSAGSIAGAHNGVTVSTINPALIAWGQDILQPGNPGQLLNDREIPLNTFSIQFIDGGVPTAGNNRFAFGQQIPFGFPTKFYVYNNIEIVGSVSETDATLIPIPFGPQPTLIAHEGFIRGLNDFSTIAIGVLGISLNVVSKANIGVQGTAYHGQAQNIGVYGNVPSNSSGTGQNIGGFFEAVSPAGSQNIGIMALAPINPGVNYAAEFIGDINFNGTLYGTNNVTVSDQMFKTNVDSISNALGILSNLQPHSYFLDTVNSVGMNFPSAKQYGLVAQEVETVLPELVGRGFTPTYFDSTTMTQYNSVPYKTLNYDAFIAILIQGVQEQQGQLDSMTQVISSMQSQINGCCSSAREASATVTQSDVHLKDSESIVLNQNTPNPFAEQTTITYFLPESVVKAQLLFYDAAGKLIKVSDLNGRGEGQVNVFADDLSNGIYSYALVADGQIADTKKMIKSK